MKGIFKGFLGLSLVVGAFLVGGEFYASWVTGTSYSERRAEATASRKAADQVAELTSTGRASVRSILKDPGSADFSDLRTHFSPEGVGALCGYVNARNSVGAYTGNTRFVSLGRPDFTWLDDRSEAFDASWSRFCYGQ